MQHFFVVAAAPVEQCGPWGTRQCASIEFKHIVQWWLVELNREEDPLEASAGNQLAMLVVPGSSGGERELGRILLATNF